MHVPELQEVKSYPKSKMFIGSLEGHVIHATWAGYEFDRGETINSEGKCNIYYIWTASMQANLRSHVICLLCLYQYSTLIYLH
jgi:hypothetical protein